MTDEEIIQLPVWKEKYDKLGVTPRELYMRQKGLCSLVIEEEEGERVTYCTDGKDKARTDRMLNPTIECVQCMVNFFNAKLDED